MIPQQLKQMFGLTSQKDVNMANNIWKMLDEMSENSPENYKQFIQKNLKEGVQEVKEKKQEKQRPFKLKPNKGFLLQFDVILNEKYLPASQENQSHKIGNKLQQKLDLSSQKWQDIKKKFKPKLHIYLNICYSDRVKIPLDKNKKELYNLPLNRLKEIEVFYYSLQGPKQVKKENSEILQLDYCMILNKNLFESLMREGLHGKKMLMSLSISYFEQRFQTDHNPLLKIYNPEIYRKLAFYSVEKLSIQVNPDRNYSYGNNSQVQQFLLEREVDIKRQKQTKQQEEEIKRKINVEQQKPEIKFKQQDPKSSIVAQKEQHKKLTGEKQQQIRAQSMKPYQANNQAQTQKTQTSSIITSTEQTQKPKRPLIQVLNETEITQKTKEELPYELKETQQGYHIQILTPGISSIEQLELQISDLKVKLKILKTSQNVEISLKNPIDSDAVKAKLKKKTSRLIIETSFLHKK